MVASGALSLACTAKRSFSTFRGDFRCSCCKCRRDPVLQSFVRMSRRMEYALTLTRRSDKLDSQICRKDRLLLYCTDVTDALFRNIPTLQ